MSYKKKLKELTTKEKEYINIRYLEGKSRIKYNFKSDRFFDVKSNIMMDKNKMIELPLAKGI